MEALRFEYERVKSENKEITSAKETLAVELDKMTEFYKQSKSDLEGTIDRLHQANRVRHELEVRLHAELEAAYRSKKTIEEKVANIEELHTKIEWYETHKRIDSQASVEFKGQIEILKRNFEFKETSLNDRIEQLNDTL